ncbi:MAG TPA: hypothetical protein VHX88_19150 [Solirubrobacteraceae bacterium]|jgi:hypothetical protein|nr:hypothetical protein [Solirubrobacteraceae bacterium]
MSALATGVIGAADDLRHPGTRDSLFWSLVLPQERIAAQVYLFIDSYGVAGRQVAVYRPEADRTVLLLEHGIDLGADADLREMRCAGLHVRQPEPLAVAELAFDAERVGLEYRFVAEHRPFSYQENPRGCPHWMAVNRYEQAGRASGVLRIEDREYAFSDIWSHRDHSWGRRDWNWVHHWKWLIAGTPSGTSLNAMFHIARGELGVNGFVRRAGDPEPAAIVDGRCEARYDEQMGQRSLVADIVDASGATTRLELERYAIFSQPFGRGSLISEAACTARIDGEPGAAQFETLWPQEYAERLAGSDAKGRGAGLGEPGGTPNRVRPRAAASKQ